DADADPELRDRRIHERPGTDRLCGAVEEHEKAVAGRRHLSAAEPVDRRSDPLVVLAEDSGPRMVAESLEHLGRAHDVAEEHGRQHVIAELLRRESEAVRAGEFERLPGFVAHHQDVVSRWNLIPLARSDDELRAVIHRYLEPARQRVADVPVLAGAAADRRL